MSVSGATRGRKSSRFGSKRQTLYRFFDAKDRLLYVGITLDPVNRLRRHRDDKEWWSLVARITLEHFGSRATVLAAEREAIQVEGPLHNIRLVVNDPAVVSLADRRSAIEHPKGWRYCPTCGTTLWPLNDELLTCARDHTWKPAR